MEYNWVFVFGRSGTLTMMSEKGLEEMTIELRLK